jgi:hypothetical protein
MDLLWRLVGFNRGPEAKFKIIRVAVTALRICVPLRRLSRNFKAVEIIKVRGKGNGKAGIAREFS